MSQALAPGRKLQYGWNRRNIHKEIQLTSCLFSARRERKVRVLRGCPGSMLQHSRRDWSERKRWIFRCVIETASESETFRAFQRSISGSLPVIVDYATLTMHLENLIRTARELIQGRIITASAARKDRPSGP